MSYYNFIYWNSSWNKVVCYSFNILTESLNLRFFKNIYAKSNVTTTFWDLIDFSLAWNQPNFKKYCFVRKIA